MPRFSCLPFSALLAQEASSGIDLRATVSAEALYSHALTESPRDGRPLRADSAPCCIPLGRSSEHWSFSGAVQIISRPYFYGDFHTQGYGLRPDSAGEPRIFKNVEQGSVVVRAGQMFSAFGAFLLRYDDAENPLLGVPMGYGYYYDPITMGLSGRAGGRNIWKVGRARAVR